MVLLVDLVSIGDVGGVDLKLLSCIICCRVSRQMIGWIIVMTQEMEYFSWMHGHFHSCSVSLWDVESADFDVRDS